MARNYDIDDDAFYAAPEHYRFSEDEIRSLNARALEDYELRVPMTPAEKRALRKWVASGHSVGESPGSKYICDLGMDFLDVYRADHEIAAAIRGKTKAEKIAYIKEYTGYVDPTPECFLQALFAKSCKIELQKFAIAFYTKMQSPLQALYYRFYMISGESSVPLCACQGTFAA